MFKLSRLATRAALSAASMLLTAELVVRLFGIDVALTQPLLKTQHVDLPDHRASANPELLYELNPGARYVTPVGSFSINSLGFRDPERSAIKHSGSYRIICFGGSNIYGAKVSDEDTYPRYLERELRRRTGRDVEVWNAGLSASVQAQNVEQAKDALDKYEPDLLLFHYSNSGRRHFLWGAPARAYFQQVPGLWEENLRYIPLIDRPWGGWLLHHCAAWRTAAVLMNYLITAPSNNEAYDNVQIDKRKFYAFEAAYRDRVKIAMIPFENREIDDFRRNVPVIALFDKKNLPANAGPEYLDIHPPPHVYRWYGEVVARELIARGYLEPSSKR